MSDPPLENLLRGKVQCGCDLAQMSAVAQDLPNEMWCGGNATRKGARLKCDAGLFRRGRGVTTLVPALLRSYLQGILAFNPERTAGWTLRDYAERNCFRRAEASRIFLKVDFTG